MPDTKHIIYSAEDIHRYFSGKMNASEMHAMEKASLEDALLAEAMEGYQHSTAFANDAAFAAIQKQLDVLKENIAGKTVGTKKYNNWWKVAAAVLLLIGSVFAFFKLFNADNKQAATVAKEDHFIKAPDAVIKTDTTATLKSTNTITAGNTISTADSVLYDKQIAVVVKPDDKIKKENTHMAAAVDYTVAENKPSFKTMESRAETASLLVFSGKITDANNNPIPYADLIINSKQQSKTDANGLFNLTLPDSSIRLDVVANNYYPTTINITANNFTAIVLTLQKNTLKKTQSLTDTNTRSIVQVMYKSGVEPKEGWEKYQLFLVDQFSNSQYDDGRKVTGEVIVQFEINALLKPDNFHFETSINEDVDNAIEDFILNHGEWQIAPHGGIPGIVRLRIIF